MKTRTITFTRRYDDSCWSSRIADFEWIGLCHKNLEMFMPWNCNPTSIELTICDEAPVNKKGYYKGLLNCKNNCWGINIRKRKYTLYQSCGLTRVMDELGNGIKSFYVWFSIKSI